MHGLWEKDKTGSMAGFSNRSAILLGVWGTEGAVSMAGISNTSETVHGEGEGQGRLDGLVQQKFGESA